MDISSKFSLVDFLAYLFPGITGTLGLFLLLLLTPLRPFLISMPIDLATGVFLLALSYVIGVVLSGFAEITIKLRAQRKSLVWVKTIIPVPGFQEEIVSAFGATFGGSQRDKVEWSSTHFYLCRSMVFEFMPGLAQRVQRQSSMRQLRMNLIPAVTIWLIVGMGWGIRAINNAMPVWGYALIIGSVLLWLLIVRTIMNRMNRNEVREVREVLTAFLAGYRKGIFNKDTTIDPTSQ